MYNQNIRINPKVRSRLMMQLDDMWIIMKYDK